MTLKERVNRRLVIGLVIVIIGVGVVVAIAFLHAVLELPGQAYAVWGTADLVIAYMEHHNGAWPRSWEDLRTLSEAAPQRIEELQRLVEVDWSADPDKLLKVARTDGDRPFRVIYLRNGKSTHYSGREPNQMILEYLLSKHGQKMKQHPE